MSVPCARRPFLFFSVCTGRPLSLLSPQSSLRLLWRVLAHQTSFEGDARLSLLWAVVGPLQEPVPGMEHLQATWQTLALHKHCLPILEATGNTHPCLLAAS